MSKESGAGKRGWLGRRRESADPSWRLRAKPLREAAEALLDSALDGIEGRIRARTRGRDARPADRLREVMERDRAVAAAQASLISASAVQAAEPDITGEDDEESSRAPEQVTASARTPSGRVVCNEPIRTRTFAKVLAAQGNYARALNVVEFLLDASPDDAELQAEAARLREALAAEG